MENEMLILFASLLAGVAVGWWRLLPQRIMNQAGRGMTAGIVLLLLSMGLRIGVDKNTLVQLGVFGLQALGFAVASILGSIGAVAFLEKLLVRESSLLQNKESLAIEAGAHPYRMTGIIITALVAGVIWGVTLFPREGINFLPRVTELALDFTLFTVGIDLGLNRQIWGQMLKLGWQVFLAPLGTAFGSIASAMLVGLLFGWSWNEGGAVGAGFGWYSLSGVLITDLHSVSLGTVAFLSNVFREILAILIVPFLVKKIGLLALVAPSGATAMDSTLPLLVASGPKGIGIIAFISGFTLSMLVPILVPLFF